MVGMFYNRGGGGSICCVWGEGGRGGVETRKTKLNIGSKVQEGGCTPCLVCVWIRSRAAGLGGHLQTKQNTGSKAEAPLCSTSQQPSVSPFFKVRNSANPRTRCGDSSHSTTESQLFNFLSLSFGVLPLTSNRCLVRLTVYPLRNTHQPPHSDM